MERFSIKVDLQEQERKILDVEHKQDIQDLRWFVVNEYNAQQVRLCIYIQFLA